MPVKRWDKIFLNACRSGPLYYYTLNRGDFFYTYKLCSARATSTVFIDSVINAKSNQEILNAINDVEPVNDFHQF